MGQGSFHLALGTGTTDTDSRTSSIT